MFSKAFSNQGMWRRQANNTMLFQNSQQANHVSYLPFFDILVQGERLLGQLIQRVTVFPSHAAAGSPHVRWKPIPERRPVRIPFGMDGVIVNTRNVSQLTPDTSLDGLHWTGIY